MAPGTDEQSTEDEGPVVLDSVALRRQYRDSYIASQGSGIEVVDSFVISTDDGDLVQLKGGATGASFYGVIFWYAVGYFGLAKLNMVASKTHIRSYCALETTEGDAYAEAAEKFAALEEGLKEQLEAPFGFKGLQIIKETDSVSLRPGETFTLKNNENYYAEKYFTEQRGMVQWGIAFEVRELHYNESYDGNADVGAEIEARTAVKGLATNLYKFLKPGTPPPEDFEIKSEEEGGFEEITGKSLFDQLGITSGALREGLTAVALFALAIAAIILMFTFRQPLGALGVATAGLIREAVER